MSLSLTMRQAGFAGHVAAGGECLVLLAGTRIVCGIRGIVNRGMDVPALERGAIDFDERNVTQIEVPKCGLIIAPLVGQVWKDSDGRFHRIRSVRSTDMSYRCVCELTEGDTDE